MRKYLRMFAIVYIILFLFGLGVRIYRLIAEDRYPMLVKVKEVSDGVVHFVDFNGNKWLWDEDDEWWEGDYACLLMNDNGTSDSIYDDRIEKAYYERTDF